VSARAVAKVILVAAGVAAALYLLYLVRSVVGLIFTSIFIAVALGPAVDLFQRLKLKRGLAILATYLSLLLAVFLVGLLIVPPIVSETNHFVKNVPRYVRDLRNDPTIRKYDQKYHITAKLEKEAAKLPSRLGSAVGALRSVTVGVFSAIVKLITVLTLAFFLLLDGRRIVEWVFRELGPVRGARARAIATDVYRSVAGYVVGNVAI
jgi:predicted PurR-regulated permease PerM